MCPATPPSASIQSDGDLTVLSLAGEFDLASRDLLDTALRDAVRRADRRLLVDLVDVSFVDCASLGMLRTTVQEASARLGTVPVVAQRRVVLKVMQLTGFSRAHVVVSTVDEARQVLDQPPPAQTG